MKENRSEDIGTRYHCKSDKERKGDHRPKKVFICSPFAPRRGTREEMKKEMERNIRIAQKACRYAALEGNVPYAPHLFFTQFLDDGDRLEREYVPILRRYKGVVRCLTYTHFYQRQVQSSGFTARPRQDSRRAFRTNHPCMPQRVLSPMRYANTR